MSHVFLRELRGKLRHPCMARSNRGERAKHGGRWFTHRRDGGKNLKMGPKGDVPSNGRAGTSTQDD